MSKSEADDLDVEYDRILGQLIRMIDNPEKWLVHRS